MEIELNLRQEPKETYKNVVIEAEIDNFESFLHWLARTKRVFIPATDKDMYQKFFEAFKMNYYYEVMDIPQTEQDYTAK